MGTPRFSVEALDLLLKTSHKIICIYSQPPKKSNRGQKINSSFIQSFAESKNLKVFTPFSLESDEEYEKFKNLNPDLVIVVAYGKIIPKKFLNIPKYGFINIHASLLPKWRGAAPIQRSIMNRDKITGVSIMKLVEKLDAGPVSNQSIVQINKNTYYEELEAKLSKVGSKLLVDCLDNIESNKANFIEQEHSKATYAKKIKKSEAKIEWNNDAGSILAQINGLNSNLGAWFEYGKERYKIFKAEILEKSGKPGEILENDLVVGCKKKAIKILEIQRQGKNRQKIEDFLIGSKIKKGTNLS